MNIINGIKSYIKEDDVKITIIKNKINIINYTDIGHFDNNKIVVKLYDSNFTIKGQDLVVSKLLNDEILITGIFDSIEFR
ncbi:MAG: YabP/YqfC family sporulation protein [bacterium]|nr:YabP/YqfC family sporulation protein [bacterium]